MYNYLLVASLEAALAQRIRLWAGGDESRIIASLGDATIGYVLKARAESRENDVDADIVSFLRFSDVLRVIRKAPELLGVIGARRQRLE